MSKIERKPSYASVVAGTHRPSQETGAQDVPDGLQAQQERVDHLEQSPAQEQAEASTDSEWFVTPFVVSTLSNLQCSGRYIDHEDPAYRGRNAKNRVEGAATSYASIIQTRAAKAASAANSTGRPPSGKR
jgi:hypothetical protein